MFKAEDYIKTKGNHTAGEIIQQPEMWRKTVDILERRLPEITAFMDRCLDRPILRVCITGAGSSGFCAETLAAAAIMYLGYKAYAPHTTDIVGSPDSVLYKDVPTLLISLARSGNSPESVGAVKYAREKIKDLFEICVTCAEDGALCKISEEGERVLKIVLPEQTCDIGFAMTSSFTSMAVAAYGILSYKNFFEFKNNIARVASFVSGGLDGIARAAKDAATGKEFDRVAFLGAGVLKGIAREAFVKMCELSAGSVNVVWDTPMGFRHGPKSMVTDSTYIMHFISCEAHTRKYDMDLLRELTAQRQGYKIIAISGSPVDIDGADYKIEFTGFTNDFYFALAGVVFAQLFAFFKSQALGVTSDDPCPGGEVNRVVKGVTIY